MTSASIPVDLFNPGQVFACLGLMEIAEVLRGDASAGFDWSDPGSVRFLLSARGSEDPISEGLRFLARAEVYAGIPDGAESDAEKWGIPSRRFPSGHPFPNPLPASPASLPAILASGEQALLITSWGDVNRPLELGTRRDNVKFWGGAGGYPGVALLRDALDAVRDQVESGRGDPFLVSALQSSSFRFDWRRDYIPLDAGFSLNDHAHIQPRGYPLVEVLAAIGVTHARPLRVHKLLYRYGAAGRPARGDDEASALLPPPILRAALGAVKLPFPMRTFTMHLGWPAKENQARCITTVLEEAPHDDHDL